MKQTFWVFIFLISLSAHALSEKEMQMHRDKQKRVLSECIGHLDRTPEQIETGERLRTSFNNYVKSLSGDEAAQSKKISGIAHVNVDSSKAILVFYRKANWVPAKNSLPRNDERLLIEKFVHSWQSQQAAESKYKLIVRFNDECETPPPPGWK